MGAKADWFDEAEDHVPAAAPKAAAKSGDWFDSAEDADDESGIASEPQNTNEPRDESWLGRAAKGFGKGSPEINWMDEIDRIPILGNISTTFGAAAHPGEYLKYKDDMKKRQEAYAKAYPESNTVKDIAASLPTMAIPQLAGAKVLQGRGLLPTGGRILASGVQNAALTGTDAAMRGDSVEDVVSKAKEGFVFGAGGQAIPEVLAKAGKGLVTSLVGVKPKTQNKYLDRHKEIDAIVPDEIHEELSRDITAIKDRVEVHKDLVRKKYAEKIEAMKVATKDLKTKMKDRSENILRDTSDRLADNILDARNQVSAASTNAFKILKKSDVKFNISPIRYKIQKMIDKNSGVATDPETGRKFLVPKPTPGNRYLQKKLDYLNKLDDEMDADFMKSLVLDIDEEVFGAKLLAAQGHHEQAGAKASEELRAAYHDYLMTVPGYDKAMIPARAKTRALENLLSKGFANNGDRVYSRLKTIDGMGNQDKAKAIQQFEETFGVKYSEALENYKRTRDYDIAKKMKPLKENAEGYLAREMARNEDFVKKVKHTDPRQSEQYLRTIGDNPTKKLPLRDDLKAIAIESNKAPGHYQQIADDYAVKRIFQGNIGAGSTATNAFQALGTFLGSFTGFVTGGSAGAAAAGALAGASANTMGREVARKILKFTRTPAGKGIGKLYDGLMVRGPGAVFAAHHALMKSNSEYRNAIENPNSEVPEQMPDDWYDSLPQN